MSLPSSPLLEKVALCYLGQVTIRCKRLGGWGGGGSRWCLQSAQHLLPVLTLPSGGRFPGCQRAAADRRRLPASLEPLHGASEGQLPRARKDVSGGGGGQGVGKEGWGGSSPGRVACLPQEVSVQVFQFHSLVITFTIQRRLGAHAPEDSGDQVTSMLCPPWPPPLTPPPTFSDPLYDTCQMHPCS